MIAGLICCVLWIVLIALFARQQHACAAAQNELSRFESGEPES